jgi:hypothetical protein
MATPAPAMMMKELTKLKAIGDAIREINQCIIKATSQREYKTEIAAAIIELCDSDVMKLVIDSGYMVVGPNESQTYFLGWSDINDLFDYDQFDIQPFAVIQAATACRMSLQTELCTDLLPVMLEISRRGRSVVQLDRVSPTAAKWLATNYRCQYNSDVDLTVSLTINVVPPPLAEK